MMPLNQDTTDSIIKGKRSKEITQFLKHQATRSSEGRVKSEELRMKNEELTVQRIYQEPFELSLV
jgi:hypothetical protein